MFKGYLNFIIESYTEKISEETTDLLLRKIKLKSLSNLISICKSYEYDFGSSKINGSLRETIFIKKADFILQATTTEELSEIGKPSIPIYNYAGFIPGSKYHVLEEELLIWSKTSLIVPLNSSASKRYIELFNSVFSENDDIKKIIDN